MEAEADELVGGPLDGPPAEDDTAALEEVYGEGESHRHISTKSTMTPRGRTRRWRMTIGVESGVGLRQSARSTTLPGRPLFYP